MSIDSVVLSQNAIERLAGLRKSGDSEGIFTSDLSVNEYILIKEAGFEPLGLVMGSSVYHLGFQFGQWGKSMELEVLTQAVYHARELAVARLEAEAIALQADGVVGVRLTINRLSWGSENVEFVAIGTAVKARNQTQNFLNCKQKPFASDLSGQDFWTLLQAGYRPLSLAMGTCVYRIAKRSIIKTMSQMGNNVELTNYTQGLYNARELAMERMQKEAHNEGAEGIVGVEIKESSYGWRPNVIEFFAIGTAVAPMETVADTHQIQPPQLVLSLNNLTKNGL